ncbi:hypothetical protein [Pseudomonas sp. Gutcm_11s]|uniref:hypothetical protein n=1 Tax=Pseudomonas sp. Gutcm_11s TaxID=3026088 RepID=UPI0023628FAE|nr:hypothetical protein [Pseudomonas sp. Gutcm_11s]MDD0842810.1 hypothetical protein [Pseudomonas sp. Gutcm_11s]
MDRAAAPPRSKLRIALAILALLAATGLAYGGWLVLPGFRPLFDSFGDNIPWLSRWAVEHPQGIWTALRGVLALNFAALCAWLFIRRRWASTALSLATTCTWLALVLLLVTLYLPMFTIAV